MVYLLRSQIGRKILNGLFACSLIGVLTYVTIATSAVSAKSSILKQIFPTPQAMLLGYYSAINLKAYPQAYSQWLAPMQNYADFASGYLTTDRVLPYFGDWQIAPANAGTNELGRIPSVLYSYHTDGTMVAYSGCFFIGSNATQTGNNIWKIMNANFKQLTAMNYFPAAAILSTALSVDCYASPLLIPLSNNDLISATPDKGQSTLTNYYNLLNKHDFLNA